MESLSRDGEVVATVADAKSWNYSTLIYGETQETANNLTLFFLFNYNSSMLIISYLTFYKFFAAEHYEIESYILHCKKKKICLIGFKILF